MHGGVCEGVIGVQVKGEEEGAGDEGLGMGVG